MILKLHLAIKDGREFTGVVSYQGHQKACRLKKKMGQYYILQPMGQYMVPEDKPYSHKSITVEANQAKAMMKDMYGILWAYVVIDKSFKCPHQLKREALCKS